MREGEGKRGEREETEKDGKVRERAPGMDGMGGKGMGEERGR